MPRANPDAPVLMAEGADYGLIGRPMTRGDLDQVLADRPIAIRAMDHHTVWANTVCLERSGLLHGAAMPAGHEVVMGPDGRATGELREFEAFDPVLALAGVARMYVGHRYGGRASGPGLGRGPRNGQGAYRTRHAALCGAGPDHADLDGRQPLYAGASGRDGGRGAAFAARQGAVPPEARDGACGTGPRQRDGGGFLLASGSALARSRCSWTGWWTAARPI